MAYIGNSPVVASQRVETALTATSNHTAFTPSSGYTLGYCDVYQNGVKLVNGDDYTASDGATVTLATGAASGDSIVIVASFPRGLSDGYLKSEADAKYVALTGDQTVAGVKTLSSNPLLSGGTANGVAYLNGSKVVTSGSALVFDGTNLGVGAAALGTAANRTVFTVNGTNDSLITIGVGGTRKASLYHDGTNMQLNNEAAGYLLFSTSNTERARFDSSGNLLVGTTTASALLSLVNAQSTAANNTTTGSIFSAVSPTSGIFMRNRGNSAGIGGATYPTQLFTDSGAGNFEIYNTAATYSLVFGTAATERVRITSGGVVGIGTNSPWSSAVLDVNGQSNFRSTMFVGNTATSQAVINYIISFDGVAYNDSSNTTVSDTGTTTGYSKRRLSSASSNGWFYGPYFDIAPGNYIAKFRLKVANNSSSSNILYIDCAGSNITSNPKGNSYRQLQPNSFAASGVYQYFDLYFTKTAWGGYIETRGLSFVTGITDMYIDHILIQPA